MFDVSVVMLDHLSGKPENVRKFDSCQGNVMDFTKSQGKNLVGKLPKTVYCKLHTKAETRRIWVKPRELATLHNSTKATNCLSTLFQ